MPPRPRPDRLPALDNLSATPLLEASPNAVVGVDAGGTIVYANPKAEDYFGWPRDELLGSSVETLLPPALAGSHVAERTRYMSQATARPMGVGRDLVARRRDGSEFPAEISLVPVATAEGPIVFATIIDITVRRSLEAQLLEARKLESVGRLAGGVAHDFNNILTAVIGHAELLLAEAATEEQRVGLETIKAGAERAAALTAQLLAYGRQQMLRPRRLDAAEVVLESEAILRPLLGEQVELVVSVASDAGSIRADRRQLDQVLLDLALYARDAMPEGGRLAIRLGHETVARPPAGHPDVAPGEYVVIALADSGAGMDEETRRRIFDPFFSTKERGRGGGLGLATAYGTVRQSGGFILVDSAPGRGSTFRIYLPRLEPEAPSSAAPRPAPPRAGGLVLVVEDEPLLRELARLVLERAGHEVRVAATPADALRVAGALGRDLDVLVSDVVMRGMSGVELANRLREIAPGLAVVLTSGYPDEAVDMPAGARFVAKPFAPEALLRAIAEAREETAPRAGRRRVR